MQGLLTGKTKSGSGYSEFHFGAGEASVIRMVAGIELADEQSMVLIEEIENGLHPVATVRMVEYLIDEPSEKRFRQYSRRSRMTQSGHCLQRPFG